MHVQGNQASDATAEKGACVQNLHRIEWLEADVFRVLLAGCYRTSGTAIASRRVSQRGTTAGLLLLGSHWDRPKPQ